MAFNLAIEFGGVNTLIYRRGQGLVLKEPSLVCAANVGQQYEIKAIGLDAEKLQGKTNDSTYIFSPVVCGEVKSLDYTAEMLKYFFRKVELRKFPKENAVILVPTGISDEAKKDYARAAKIAGIGKVCLIPTVVCSAYATGEVEQSKTKLCVHIGGTLTDVAAINMNSILKGCSIELGGRYLDIEIAQYISKKHKVEISIASAKRLKEEIATLVEGDVRTADVIGIDEGSGKPKQIVVSSEEILPMLDSFMDNIISAIETTLNVCPPEVSGDVAQEGIYVSGGLSSILGLSKFLAKKLQIKVNVIPDGDNAPLIAAGKLLSNKKLLLEIVDNF